LSRRSRVYRRLVGAAPLGDRHRADLVRRHFTAAEIDKRRYGSLPEGRRRDIAKEVHNGHPDDLAGVPGFWQWPNEDWSIYGIAGLLIPCLDPAGQVRGMRLRPDEADGGGKYRWLSSANKNKGAGSGVHCHVARPLGAKTPCREVWVTEGELKADRAAECLQVVVVSIPGVGSWARAIADLATLLPKGGRVVVAMDADWRANVQVHAAAWGLLQAGGVLGYEMRAALWDTKQKGLDDLLGAGGNPEVRPPAEVPAPAWPAAMKVSSRILVGESASTSAATAIPLARMRALLAEAFASGQPRCV
jgi:hypothetical protein